MAHEIVPRKTEGPISTLHHEMDRMFNDFFGGLSEWFGESRVDFVPSVDVSETDTEIHVTAEVPGLDENDLHTYFDRGALILEGQKKQEHEDKGRNYFRIERSYGAFRRVVQIPAEVETDKIRAEYKKGLLTITLPKSPKAQNERKEIPVQTE